MEKIEYYLGKPLAYVCGILMYIVAWYLFYTAEITESRVICLTIVHLALIVGFLLEFVLGSIPNSKRERVLYRFPIGPTLVIFSLFILVLITMWYYSIPFVWCFIPLILLDLTLVQIPPFAHFIIWIICAFMCYFTSEVEKIRAFERTHKPETIVINQMYPYGKDKAHIVIKGKGVYLIDKGQGATFLKEGDTIQVLFHGQEIWDIRRR